MGNPYIHPPWHADARPVQQPNFYFDPRFGGAIFKKGRWEHSDASDALTLGIASLFVVSPRRSPSGRATRRSPASAGAVISWRYGKALFGFVIGIVMCVLMALAFVAGF